MQLYKTSNPSPETLRVSLELFDPRVTEELNLKLEEPFSQEEIIVALTQMHPLKAPGPDGFSTEFYKKHWPLV